MRKRLDDVDRRLLQLLRENARSPVLALARGVGLSRTATQERLARLERDGVIQGYTARVRANPDTATVRAWLLLTLKPGVACADVAPLLIAVPEVSVCHSLAGAADMLVLIDAATLEEVSSIREKIALIDGVLAITTAPVLADHLGLN